MDSFPWHSVHPQSVANPQTRLVGAHVTACQNCHRCNDECQDAKQRQPMRQWEQCADLNRQQQPADGAKYAERDAGDYRDHPYATRPRHIDGVIEIVISHS